ncbi:MAG: hypothetical protein RL670_752 [Actinomycetota bacterium]
MLHIIAERATRTSGNELVVATDVMNKKINGDAGVVKLMAERVSYLARLDSKNSFSCAEHSASSTPLITSTGLPKRASRITS